MADKPSISRYRASTGTEGACQPGSRGRVLLNKQGITRKREMDQAEVTALLTAQHKYLESVTRGTIFTASFICRMHRDWLDGLYSWAGAYRTVELSTGSFVWPPARFVVQNMTAIEQETLRPCTPCVDVDIEQVALKMARVQADILMVHPFREGNGRLARWLTDLMALQANQAIPVYGFKKAGHGATGKQYLAAVIRGHAKDYAPLARFLRDAMRRGLAAQEAS